MADITITAANVKVESGAVIAPAPVQVGEAVTQGKVGYLDSATGKYMLAQSDGTAAQAAAAGIFVTPAATNGSAVLAKSGPMDLGATLVVGTTYVVSQTAGGIAPIADVASGDFVTILGVAVAADQLTLNIVTSGIEAA